MSAAQVFRAPGVFFSEPGTCQKTKKGQKLRFYIEPNVHFSSGSEPILKSRMGKPDAALESPRVALQNMPERAAVRSLCGPSGLGTFHQSQIVCLHVSLPITFKMAILGIPDYFLASEA